MRKNAAILPAYGTTVYIAPVRRGVPRYTCGRQRSAPMAIIAIAKKHELSHAKAKEAAQKIADDLAKRFDLNCEWKGDRIEFERPGVSGELHVGKAEVRLDCQLGFLLSMLKPTIEDAVNRDFDKYFGNAKAKPKPKSKR
jgi:putative polyhydroxyalkanoate system protein